MSVGGLDTKTTTSVGNHREASVGITSTDRLPQPPEFSTGNMPSHADPVTLSECDILSLVLAYDECSSSSSEEGELLSGFDESSTKHSLAVFNNCQLDVPETNWVATADEPRTRTPRLTVFLDHRLGGGMFGDVYKARLVGDVDGELDTGGPVAIKILKRAANQERTFRREVSSLQRLGRCAGVVDLVATRPETCWIVMPLLDPLVSWTPRWKASDNPLAAVVDAAAQLASTLHILHSQSPPVLHRDVTVENILIRSLERGKADKRGSGPGTFEVVLGDLGVSVTHDELRSAGIMELSPNGNPSTRAPEVVQGVYGLASEVYSWGCTVSQVCVLAGVDLAEAPVLDNLLTQCNAFAPSSRPGWKRVLSALSSIRL